MRTHSQRDVKVHVPMNIMLIIILILVFLCALTFMMSMDSGVYADTLVFLVDLLILRLIELALETVVVLHSYFLES